MGMAVQSIMILFIVLFSLTADAGAASGVEVSGDLTISNAGSLIFPDGTAQTTASAPTWYQVLPALQRFQLVMGGNAVLDRETGLVWVKAPDTLPWEWHAAVSYCYSLDWGGRSGWRLPAATELASLVDKSVGVNITPKLPIGHPFANILPNAYWSSSAPADYPITAWSVNMGDGTVNYGDKSSGFNAWCVRGGQ